MSVGTSGSFAGTATTNVTVDTGSNRRFIAVFAQARAPLNLVPPYTLNGVAGNVVYSADSVAVANYRMVIVEWLEAVLPSAGTYTLDCGVTDNQSEWLNLVDVSQSAITVSNVLDGQGNSISTTLTPYNQGDTAIFGGWSGTFSAISSGVRVGTNSRGVSIYNENDGTIAFTTSNFAYYGGLAFIVPEAARSVTVTTPPTDINVGTANSVTVTSTATAPTTGNTTVNINGLPVTPSSVVANGGDSYTINFTAPRSLVLLYSATGYPVSVTVGADTSADTANIPFLSETGTTWVDAINPNTVDNWSFFAGYTGNIPVTGFQGVYATPVGSTAITVLPSGAVQSSPKPTATTPIPRYFREQDGTVGTQSSYILEVDGSPVPSGNKPTLTSQIPNQTTAIGANTTVDVKPHISGATSYVFSNLPIGANDNGDGTATLPTASTDEINYIEVKSTNGVFTSYTSFIWYVGDVSKVKHISYGNGVVRSLVKKL